jgi:hypothetical protein
VVGVAVGGLAAVVVAAAACFRRRQRQGPSKRGGLLGGELLQVLLGDGDATVATAAGATSVAAAQRLQLTQGAEHDPQTGFPQNLAAKQLAALNWRAGPGSSAAGVAGVVVALPFAELAQATHNFDVFNALGTGGSCDVFKGHVFGLQVAVKRLNAGGSEWAEQQFTSEMELLTKIAHPNICSLYAFSTDGPNRCLVLELCTGGTLNDRLSCKAEIGNAPPPPLLWQQRVQIAQGILQALEFLHSLTPQMIHRQESYSRPALQQHPSLARSITPILSPRQGPQDTERAFGCGRQRESCRLRHRARGRRAGRRHEGHSHCDGQQGRHERVHGTRVPRLRRGQHAHRRLRR